MSKIQKREAAGVNFEEKAQQEFAFLTGLKFKIIECSQRVLRYQSGEIEVEIFYGYQSYEVGFNLIRRNIRYSMSEFIRLMDTDYSESYRYSSATTQSAMDNGLINLAKHVKLYCLEALNNENRIFLELDQLRVVWAKKYEVEVLAHTLRPKAHEAFRVGNYQLAVDCYTQIKSLLSATELKKLALAESKIETAKNSNLSSLHLPTH